MFPTNYQDLSNEIIKNTTNSLRTYKQINLNNHKNIEYTSDSSNQINLKSNNINIKKVRRN